MMTLTANRLVWLRVSSGAVLALALVLRTPLLQLELHTLNVIASLTFACAIWATAVASPRHLWSAPCAYLVVFGLFHLGLPWLDATSQPVPEYFQGYVSSWFNSYTAAYEAVYLSLLAMCCFTFGCLVASRVEGTEGSESIGPDQSDADDQVRHREVVASNLGGGLVIVGVGLVLGYVAVTRPDLLFTTGGSRGFWSGVAGSGPALLGGSLITLGSILVALGRRTTLRRAAFVCLGVYGLWSLAVGDRTGIMYPLLTMVVVMARVPGRLPRRGAAIGVVAALMIVAFVGQSRLGGSEASRATADPRAAVAEMGGSLRPVVEVVTYHRVNGEPSQHGLTYVSFAVRAAESLLGLPRPDGLDDPRIASNEFRGRLDGYQIGYSAVAEAFRNGATPGVFIVFLLIGSLLGRLDHRPHRSAEQEFLLGVAFYLLAYHVRQPSVTLLAGFCVAAIILVVWRILSRMTFQRQSPSTPPSELLRNGEATQWVR